VATANNPIAPRIPIGFRTGISGECALQINSF
jgi:hypothetical protein